MSLSALPMILGVNINKVQRQGSKLHIMCQSIACLAIYVAFPQFFPLVGVLVLLLLFPSLAIIALIVRLLIFFASIFVW